MLHCGTVIAMEQHGITSMAALWKQRTTLLLHHTPLKGDVTLSNMRHAQSLVGAIVFT